MSYLDLHLRVPKNAIDVLSKVVTLLMSNKGLVNLSNDTVTNHFKNEISSFILFTFANFLNFLHSDELNPNLDGLGYFLPQKI